MTGSCEDYRDDLAAAACGALPGEEEKALERHLEVCATCRSDLERLHRALAPLADYHVEPPERLVELTQRHVARQMTMRLPRPGRLSRPRVVRLVAAAAVLMGFTGAFLLPALRRTARERPSGGMETTAQLQGLFAAINDYAQANGGWLPPAEGWLEALKPFLGPDGRSIEQERSSDYIFLQGLRNWFLGLRPDDVLVLVRPRRPDAPYGVLTRTGSVETVSETEALLLLRSAGRRPGREGER